MLPNTKERCYLPYNDFRIVRAVICAILSTLKYWHSTGSIMYKTSHYRCAIKRREESESNYLYRYISSYSEYFIAKSRIIAAGIREYLKELNFLVESCWSFLYCSVRSTLVHIFHPLPSSRPHPPATQSRLVCDVMKWQSSRTAWIGARSCR
jgi:hypothetical protein